MPFTLPLGSFSESVVATKPPSSAAILVICTKALSKPSTSKSISPLRMILRDACPTSVAGCGIDTGAAGTTGTPAAGFCASEILRQLLYRLRLALLAARPPLCRPSVAWACEFDAAGTFTNFRSDSTSFFSPSSTSTKP